MDLGDYGALENFDFDSFLHNDEHEHEGGTLNEARFRGLDDLRNYGSTQMKLANKGTADDFVESDSMDMNLKIDENYAGGTPHSPGFSPTPAGYSPITP